VDVISQGRDPKRDFRRPWSRRWRIVAGCAAVLVAAITLTVIGLRTSHDAGTTGAGAAAVAPPPLPRLLPQAQIARMPTLVVCSPSPHQCTNKFIIVGGRVAHFSQQVHVTISQVPPTP
jgi:hypothetical protein